MLKLLMKMPFLIPIALACLPSCAQAIPATPGETLTGKRIILAEAVRGQAAVLVVGFSKDAGDGCGDLASTVRADPSLQGIAVYQVAMLERAPGFVRGTIKSSLRKGLSVTQQDHFVVLTQDEMLWRSYFGVTSDKDPYALLLDAKGQVRWRGHGAAKDIEPLLRSAKP